MKWNRHLVTLWVMGLLGIGIIAYGNVSANRAMLNHMTGDATVLKDIIMSIDYQLNDTQSTRFFGQYDYKSNTFIEQSALYNHDVEPVSTYTNFSLLDKARRAFNVSSLTNHVKFYWNIRWQSDGTSRLQYFFEREGNYSEIKEYTVFNDETYWYQIISQAYDNDHVYLLIKYLSPTDYVSNSKFESIAIDVSTGDVTNQQAVPFNDTIPEHNAFPLVEHLGVSTKFHLYMNYVSKNYDDETGDTYYTQDHQILYEIDPVTHTMQKISTVSLDDEPIQYFSVGETLYVINDDGIYHVKLPSVKLEKVTQIDMNLTQPGVVEGNLAKQETGKIVSSSIVDDRLYLIMNVENSYELKVYALSDFKSVFRATIQPPKGYQLGDARFQLSSFF